MSYLTYGRRRPPRLVILGRLLATLAFILGPWALLGAVSYVVYGWLA